MPVLAPILLPKSASTGKLPLQAAEAMGVRRPLSARASSSAPTAGRCSRMLLPFKLFAGGKIGSGQQGFPWIHIADEIGAIRFLIDTAGAHRPI